MLKAKNARGPAVNREIQMYLSLTSETDNWAAAQVPLAVDLAKLGLLLDVVILTGEDMPMTGYASKCGVCMQIGSVLGLSPR